MIPVSLWGPGRVATWLLSCFLWLTALPGNSQDVLTYPNNNARTGLNSTKGGLAVADYFEMDNEQQENNSDTDLGSGGVLLLPPMKDSSGKGWQLRPGRARIQTCTS
jgi:hypothetical protein